MANGLQLFTRALNLFKNGTSNTLLEKSKNSTDPAGTRTGLILTGTCTYLLATSCGLWPLDAAIDLNPHELKSQHARTRRRFILSLVHSIVVSSDSK